MTRNYLKTTLRHLNKHRSYTAINLAGLSLGISCSLILFLLIKFWLSFDTYHEKADRIYRVVRDADGPTGRDFSPGVSRPVPDAFRNDFPEIEEAVFISSLDYTGALFTVEDVGGNLQSFQEEEHIAYTEPTFFRLFDRAFVMGNPTTALNESGTVVLSERMARKYFGEQSPLGKTITYNKTETLLVTGIMEDYPDNTDFPFDMFIAYETLKRKQEAVWSNVNSSDQFYVLLPENVSPEEIESRLPAFTGKYHGEDHHDRIAYHLQALQDMHFDTRYSTFGQNEIPKPMIWMLGLVAVFLVFLACVNFVNLATAISTKRAREVGVRKTLGSTQPQLMRQFLGETTAITVCAVLIALCLTEVLLLKVNSWLELSLRLSLMHDPWVLLFLLSLVVVISLFSGLYPAWTLSRFQPVDALKNVLQKNVSRGFSLRKGLIVFQFVIAQVFIIGTLVLLRQMQYLQETDLGFQGDAVVSLRLPESENSLKKTLQIQLQRTPGIAQVSLAFATPASGSTSMTNYQMKDNPEWKNVEVKTMDKYYLTLFDIKLLAGEDIGDSDTLSRVIVNEAFVRQQGYASPEEALGKVMKLWGREIPIIGVVQDFTTRSLHEAVEPTILLDDTGRFRLLAVKLQGGNHAEALKAIEKQWKIFYPEYTYDYQFVDETVAEFYEREQKMSDIFSASSLVVIFIGCLGLYGLVIFLAEQKTKEVGVRKVLGASVASIVGLFSREFMILIGIAFIVAAPLAYFIMREWLQNFAVQIALGPGLFLSGMVATLLIALLTVSYQSIKAAMANPVDSLRNE